jgi:hypothetical protein
VTLHFFKEEWDEFLKLIRALPRGGDGQGGAKAGR